MFFSFLFLARRRVVDYCAFENAILTVIILNNLLHINFVFVRIFGDFIFAHTRI